MAIKSKYESDRMSGRFRQALKFLCSFALLAASLVTSPAETPPEATVNAVEPIRLNAGAVINRELAAGAKELIEISLGSGDLLRLSMQKGDLATSLTLYDPAGQKLLERVSYDYELLAFSVAVDTAGTYRLEIRSLELDKATRHYELKFDPISRATPTDYKSNTAQLATADATVLRANWKEDSLRQAIERYDKAGLIWFSLNDLRRAAVATMEAGEVYSALGEYREALKRFQKAAAYAKNAGAKLEESTALAEAGRLYSYLGDNDQAQKQALQALKLAALDSHADQPANHKASYAAILNILGEISYSKGDLLKSSKQFETALKLFVEIGDRDGEARAHLFVGYITGTLGDPEKAFAELSRSLELYRAIKNKTGEGLCLSVLGLVPSLNGGEERAIRMHREAIDIFRMIGDRQGEAIAVNGLGQAYENLKEYPTALDNYRQTLRLAEDTGNLDLACVTLLKVGRVYMLIGDLNQALACYEKSLKLSRSARNVRTEMNALNDVAVLYAAQGNRQKTIGQYRKIIRFYASITDRRRQAIAWNNLGDAYFRFKEKQEALKAYTRGLPLSEQAGDKAVLISSLYNIARTQRDLGALELALASIQKSIGIIEDLRISVTSPDFRISYFSGVRKHYDLCIDILMQLDHQYPGHAFDTEALLMSEKARARSLFDTLTEVRVDIRPGVAPELLARERYLSGLIRSQARYQMELSISGKDPAETEEVASQVNQLRTEYQELEAQLRDQNPRSSGLNQSSPLSLAEIQAQLCDGDTILLEYALGDERSYLWAVTADSLRSYELPSRTVLEKAAQEVYKLLTARQGVETKGGDYQANVEASDRAFYDKALNLSQLLLGPVADQLGTKRLVIVTEGMLQYVPVDSLPVPQPKVGSPIAGHVSLTMPEDVQVLLDTNEIVKLPSISTLEAIRQQKPTVSSNDKIVAIFADPVFNTNDDRFQNRKTNSDTTLSNSDQDASLVALRDVAGNSGPQRLVHSSEEADAIVATTPHGTAMVAKAFDANRETAMRPSIGEYRIVHFATHAFYNSEHPELSGIVLAMVKPDGSKINGFMPLQDIYKLNLSAQLVVVSACETALGKDIKGEGLVSLSRGFMYAGSKSVVTSLWKVDDRATAKLMKTFYESMLRDGMTPAAALRSAKQKIRRERAWSEPFFWAGFELQGEYKDRIVSRKEPSRMVPMVSIVLVLIAVALIIFKRRRRPRLLNRYA